jgi:hypothetical protein
MQRESGVFSDVVPESSAAFGGTGVGGGGTSVGVAPGVGETDFVGTGGNLICVGVGKGVAVDGIGNTVTLTVADTEAPSEGTTRYVNVSVPTYPRLGV